MHSTGMVRSTLMAQVTGSIFYDLRGLYLQYTLGDFTKDKARIHKICSDKEKETWCHNTGHILLDAYGVHLTKFKALKDNIFHD